MSNSIFRFHYFKIEESLELLILNLFAMKTYKVLLILFLIFSTANSFSKVNDTLLFTFSNNDAVYKNLKTNTYSIGKDNVIVFKDLKYVECVGNYLQVLDSKNEQFFLDANCGLGNEKKSSNEASEVFFGYKYEIVENENNYVLMEAKNIKNKTNLDFVAIDSVSKYNVDDISFYNGLKVIDVNFKAGTIKNVFPNALIIKQGNFVGIHLNGKTEYFDNVQLINDVFLVSKNNKLGYYNITKAIKYKKLDKFYFGLAQFENYEGQTGFINKNGEEFFD